jgi:hypothetical protein
MKNLLKFLGTIAIVAIVGFTLASCGGSTMTPEDPPPPPDTSVWELQIVPPNEYTNGLWICITGGPDSDVGDTFPAYAYGSAGLKYDNGILEGIDVDDSGNPLFTGTTLYIAARIGPAAGVKKVDKKPSYKIVTEVAEDAFTGSALTKVVVVADNTSANIPAANKKYNLKTIGVNAFSSSSDLVDFELPEGLETISESAFEGTAIADLAIPSTVKLIDTAAFKSVIATAVSIKAGALEEIGDSAFEAFGVAAPILSIPSSLTKIGENAFKTTGISIIKFSGAEVAAVGNGAFDTFTGILQIDGLGAGQAGLRAADVKWNGPELDDPATTDVDESDVDPDGTNWRDGLNTAASRVLFDDVPVTSLSDY